MTRGNFELIGHNLARAREHYETALATAIRCGYQEYERDCLTKIECCLGRRDHVMLHVRKEAPVRLVADGGTAELGPRAMGYPCASGDRARRGTVGTADTEASVPLPAARDVPHDATC